MLSSLNCVGRRYCRFSPFASISFASLLEHGIAQNHVSFTNARLCFAQAPWYTSEIHMNINTKTPWRHEEDIDNVDHTQKAKSAPNPAQPHQSQTPRPTAQHAQHGQIPRPTQPSAPYTESQICAQPSPDPTPNPAQRAQHSQIPAQHSTARPPACPVSFFLR